MKLELLEEIHPGCKEPLIIDTEMKPTRPPRISLEFGMFLRQRKKLTQAQNNVDRLLTEEAPSALTARRFNYWLGVCRKLTREAQKHAF